MSLYGGIDLHSRISWLVILDGALKLVRQIKLANSLAEFLRVLEPYRGELAGLAVKSTPGAQSARCRDLRLDPIALILMGVRRGTSPQPRTLRVRPRAIAAG